MTHIPTRFFSDAFNMQERWDIINKYAAPCWDAAKEYSHKDKISKSAIKIAERIKKELDIELFPLVQKVAYKGFDCAGGSYAFKMVDKKGDEYYFDHKAKFFLQKRFTPYLNDRETREFIISLC